MSNHRADQIIDAAVTAIQAAVPSTIKVYAHRRLSLGEDQDELPAISVDFGGDEPLDDDGASNMAFIDSLLTVNVVAVLAAGEERDLKTDLLDMRRKIHVAMMTDRTLGLAFVADTRYQGAEDPEFFTENEALLGSLSTSWAVHYRMNIADPGD